MTKEMIIEEAENFAKEINTLFEVRDNSNYGNWTAIDFMTDRFGGTYVHIHLDNETLEMINWYGSDRQKTIKDISALKELVIKEKAIAEKSRDFDSLYEFINSQY